ncbi:hypothetical protein Tsubulata_017056 [Turnera subulata]|uniref:Cytochrome P450 n=1 Tax=Turnera subulata TaxID=218843 RepID=A0A9Q0IZ95_9ROSI|nr:hypothetical protein Tsubulata_017056 [Turnera subulata]
MEIASNILTKASNKKMAPKVRGGLPLIAHIHMLGSKPTHRVLSHMADKYGPVFTINLGVYPTLVVNNWEMAKECLTTNDKAFANRLQTLAAEIFTYDGAIFGFGQYGNLWGQLRKFLSNHRVDAMRDVIDDEIRASMKELYKLWYNNNDSDKGVKVEMRGWFADLSMNVLLRTIVGKTIGYGPTGDENGWKKGLKEFIEFCGMFVLSDMLPFLRFLDLGGHEKAMRKGLMLAASDTAAVTLVWALAAIINNPRVLKKIQLELDSVVGKERLVQESDFNDLVYLKAVVKEVQRLYPAAPLAVPHESLEDCTLGGYHVPKGTRLLINVWKIHRDPRVWPNPDEFLPERFLITDKDMDVRGPNFKYIPFGGGRRMCPGIYFALQELQMTLATFIQGLEFDRPSGEPIDMSEGIGLTYVKAMPFDVLIKPRLPSHLYA